MWWATLIWTSTLECDLFKAYLTLLYNTHTRVIKN